jgi:hypothetical protein
MKIYYTLEAPYVLFVRSKLGTLAVFGSFSMLCGLKGIVVNITDCYPKGAGLDSRVMLGIFRLRT